MSLNRVIIEKGPSGLGRPLSTQEHISGFVFYSTSLPSGFSNSARIKEIFSVNEAENLGITNTHIGETRAYSTFAITASGSTNSTAAFNVVTSDSTVAIGTFTQDGTYNTTSLVAAQVISSINNLSATTGFNATGTSANITVIAPAGSGLGANSWSFSNTFTGSVSAITGTFTAGVSSQLDILHYHISEYFRLQPQGYLFIGVYSSTTDYSEAVLVQNFSLGKIRQFGIYTQSAFSSAIVQHLQAAATLIESNEKPAEIFLQADFSSVSDLSTLEDVHNYNSQNVSVCFGQDGAAIGYGLWKANLKSIGVVGCFLGATAFAKVSDSVAYPAKFRLDSVELETLSFANGSKVSAQADSLLDNIDDKGYIMCRYFASYPGSFFNNPYTATLVTSDYSRVPNNRTINKAFRTLKTFLTPQLASPVFTKAGLLSEGTIAFYKTICQDALESMISGQEISEFSITINPSQNVVSTGLLTIGVGLTPVGTADNILVQLGFQLSSN